MKRLFAALMVLSCLSVANLAISQTYKPGVIGSSGYVPAPTFTPAPVVVPTPLFGNNIVSTPIDQTQLTNQLRMKVRRHRKTVATPTATPYNSGIVTGSGSVQQSGAQPK